MPQHDQIRYHAHISQVDDRTISYWKFDPDTVEALKLEDGEWRSSGDNTYTEHWFAEVMGIDPDDPAAAANPDWERITYDQLPAGTPR